MPIANRIVFVVPDAFQNIWDNETLVIQHDCYVLLPIDASFLSMTEAGKG